MRGTTSGRPTIIIIVTTAKECPTNSITAELPSAPGILTAQRLRVVWKWGRQFRHLSEVGLLLTGLLALKDLNITQEHMLTMQVPPFHLQRLGFTGVGVPEPISWTPGDSDRENPRATLWEIQNMILQNSDSDINTSPNSPGGAGPHLLCPCSMFPVAQQKLLPYVYLQSSWEAP